MIRCRGGPKDGQSIPYQGLVALVRVEPTVPVRFDVQPDEAMPSLVVHRYRLWKDPRAGTREYRHEGLH